MTTPIDLRVRFKSETGEFPMWPSFFSDLGGIITTTQSFNRGKFKSTYGLWLEEKLGNKKDLRDEFYLQEGVHPIFPKNRWADDWLHRDYIQWLEDKLIEHER